jgi:hypothetical protein
MAGKVSVHTTFAGGDDVAHAARLATAMQISQSIAHFFNSARIAIMRDYTACQLLPCQFDVTKLSIRTDH